MYNLLILYKLDIFCIFTSQLENPAELQLQEILLDTKKVKIIYMDVYKYECILVFLA